MLRTRLTVNEDVVKVNYKKFSHKRSQYLSHLHKGTRSISQSKWQDRPFLQYIFHFESHLSFISGTNVDLVITTFQINL